MRWLISFLFVTVSVEAAYVVNNAGRRIVGLEISAEADGRVVLKTASGQMMTFQKGQYRSAAADRPKELDIAERLFREGRGEEAVPFLKRVKTRCRFLKWDQQAIQLLADYYFEAGDFAQAATEFQALENQDIPQNRARLRMSMVKGGDPEMVKAVLDEDIRTGSRNAAAQAYVMRGRLKADNGDVSGARRDWMKVSLFFKAQKDVAAEAENLLKESEG